MLSRELTRGAGFVCLRCRLQLAGARKRPPFAAAAFPSSRTAQRSIGTHDRPSNTEPKSDTVRRDESSTVSWPSPAPPPRRPRPHERTYTSRGQIVTPEQEGLDVAMLGKPGSAIVLREKRTRKKKRQLAELKPDSDAPETHVDPASLLVDEDAAADSEDVLLNIHELRPKDKRILSDKAFTQLRDTLVDGFTNAQLTRYVREYEAIQQLNQEDTHEDAAQELPPWVLEHQPWTPISENGVDVVEPHLAGYITKGMAPKARLAVRLMRNCWDLCSQSVLDRDGYLSLRLRDVEFSLLTLGNRRWLEGTQRAILAHVREVRLIRESRLVSVVAPKHAADAIVDRIHGVLSKARTSEFETDLVSPEPLEPRILEEVGRVTNTVTRLDPSGKKVVVTWIHMPQRDENFENACETVLRFLRHAYGPKTGVSTALRVVPEDLIHQGRYLPALNPEQKLPWQERSAKWERWTAAVPHWNADSKPASGSVPADILPFSLRGEKTVKHSDPVRVAEDPESEPSSPGWSTEAQTDTSVVFGHVVFARQKSSATSSTPSPEPEAQLDTSLPRTFVPILPALGSLNVPNNLKEEGLWHSTTVIRFSPSPDVPSDLAASAPDLELLVEADHVEVKALTSLRAVKETFIGDVLFPAAPVDARLVQRRYFSLPGASIEQHVPSIITFVTKSDLRPWAGKLSTPPVLLGVHLPRRLLTPTATSQDDGTATPNNNGGGGGDDDKVRVDYTFASIQVQRTVTAEYENLRLRYTSIQAGQRGGERAELSLEAVRVAAPPPEDVESSQSGVAEVVDEDELVDDEVRPRARFISHSKNSPDKSPALTDAEAQARAVILARPVGLEEFLRVASEIVHEKGRLKWHAKRS
ncbi:mitochondrial inner-membrane-bound regulator-domain-containing protein [Thermothelomyces heterothallicus CBS 202.75]|uniref:mitochondrial inner-membrane-bound regulator-domain-containing protein n=1 Tax=Thermothelomyces heterothallicus CBS 202.75 TaxID=1149848 RepID=UPI003743E64E